MIAVAEVFKIDPHTSVLVAGQSGIHSERRVGNQLLFDDC